MQLRHLLPAASLALAPLGLAQQDLAALVPNDAFLVIRGTSSEALQAALTEATQTFAPGEAPPPLSELIPYPEEAIAQDQPVAWAMSLVGGQPKVTTIVPLKAAGAGKDDVFASPQGLHRRWQGRYMSLSELADYPAGASPLMEGLPTGMVSARLDMASLVEEFRPVIDMGLDQVQMMMDMGMAELSPEELGGIDAMAMMDLYFDAIEDFLDSGRWVDAAVNLRGGVATMDASLHVLEGSAMEGMGSETRADLGKMARRLPSGTDTMTMVMGLDYADYEELFGPMMEAIMEIYPEEMQAPVQSYMDGYAAALQNAAPALASAFNIANGMQMTTVMEAKESGGDLVGALRGVLDAAPDQGTPYAFTGLRDHAVAGLEGFLGTMVIDMDVMTQMLTAGEEGMDAQVMSQITRALYGDGNFDVWMGAADKLALMTMGSDSAWREGAVLAAKAGESTPGAGLSWCVERIAGRTPSLGLEMDLGKLIQDMIPIMKQLDPEMDMPPEELPKSVPFSEYFVVEDTAWHMGVHVPLAPLAEFIRHAE